MTGACLANVDLRDGALMSFGQGSDCSVIEVDNSNLEMNHAVLVGANLAGLSQG